MLILSSLETGSFILSLFYKLPLAGVNTGMYSSNHFLELVTQVHLLNVTKLSKTYIIVFFLSPYSKMCMNSSKLSILFI